MILLCKLGMGDWNGQLWVIQSPHSLPAIQPGGAGEVMSIPVKWLLPNGSLVDAPIAASSLNEVASKEPEGVYTVARTFQANRVVLLDAHLDRLEESARLEGIELALDRGALRKGLKRLIEESKYPESRFRITIPKGEPDRIWLAAEPLQQVSATYRRHGVAVETCKITRPNPKAKSNAWVNLRNEAVKSISEQTYEGIILNKDAYLMEGFSSNFYAILESKLHTAEEEILHGIARRIILEIAPGRIPLSFKPIHIDQLQQIEEAFLTSSSRGIVPIVRINDFTIGDGKPGERTHQLSAAYKQWVGKHMQPIA
jgi:branched-chain amino acid aminotransferase